MHKKSLAMAWLLAAGSAQAAVISAAGNFNDHGYDVFSQVVTEDGVVSFQDTTAPAFDSLISLFDDAGDHIFSGDEDAVSGIQFRLSQNLDAGVYWVLVTSARGVAYLTSEGAGKRPTDGFNPGGDFYSAGDGTLAGMKTFLDGSSDVLSGRNYRLDIGTSVPEPASYALVALALMGLAYTRRRSA